MKTHTLTIMDHTGDSTVEFNPQDLASVDHARNQFDQLRKKNYLAFLGGKDGKPAELIRAFDPNAENTVLTPPLTGG